MSNQKVIASLKAVLADSYTLYLKTQNYHWNVEGPQFYGLHELFEAQYTDLATAIDEIAELIRTFGEKAPGTWKAYASLTCIAEGDESADARSMITDLLQDQEKILKTLNDGILKAQPVGDEVVVGVLTERMTVHRKNLWMLKSMLT